MKQIPKFSEHIASRVNEAKTLTKEEIIEKFNLTLNPDGSYDAPDYVDLANMGLTKLPLKFGKVIGWFDCSFNQLTSLEGCPEEIKGEFNCTDNKLITLEGGPKDVVARYYCSRNQLTSLEGSPEKVGGFICTKNKLTSLKGGPKEVARNFDCSHNQLVTLEGAPETVGGYFDCTNNKLTELPKKLNCDTLVIFDGNKIGQTSVEGAGEIR